MHLKKTWGEFTISLPSWLNHGKLQVANHFHAHQTTDCGLVHAPSMEFMVLVYGSNLKASISMVHTQDS